MGPEKTSDAEGNLPAPRLVVPDERMVVTRNQLDPSLLPRARAGDKDAFERLVAPHLDRLFRLVHALVGNDADAADITQEAIIKAYRAIGGFRGDADLFTWLARIARNACYDEVKRAARRHEEPVEDLPEVASERSLERQSEQAELVQLVHGAIATLSDKLRDPLVLYDIEGYSYEEIAGIMGLNLGTVKSRLNRAREALRVQLLAHQERLSGYLPAAAHRSQELER